MQMQLGFLQKKQIHFFFKIYNCTTLDATILIGFKSLNYVRRTVKNKKYKNHICMFPNFID